MATPVLMPKQGQSVETCLILAWNKQVGDAVNEGDILCEVETDKATFEIEAPASGTLLVHFFDEGDDVPVLLNIAVIGNEGDNTDEFRPDEAGGSAAPEAPASTPEPVAEAPVATAPATPAPAASQSGAVSPRARKLAADKGISPAGIAGTGPSGRVIERDVQAALASGAPLTPAARAAAGAGPVPAVGTGIGGRVTTADLTAAPAAAPEVTIEDQVTVVPVKGIRKLIAERMKESLQTTAQLTMNSSADASKILAYRSRLKASPEVMGLQKVSITDLILYVTARVLAEHPEMNCTFTDGALNQYSNVHLGVAVDTPRGLMVPVIRNANHLSLKQISGEIKRLAKACLEGGISPDDLSGGTFTVTNLGHLGIESFTPVINPPQVGILGVGNTQLKPVQVGDDVKFLPHLGLSITIDHQVVDGAPAARFLQEIASGLANIDLFLAQ